MYEPPQQPYKPDHSGHNKPDHSGHRHTRRPHTGPMPEFIVIDDAEQPNASGPQFSSTNLYDQIQKLQQKNFPWALRVLSLAMSVLAFGWMLGTICLLAIIGALVLLSFGQVEQVKNMYVAARENLKKAFAFFIGFLTATFNPALGIGFIFLFFLLRGEAGKTGAFTKFFFR